MKEKNKGITLIALVITIIILLILAGVTIGQLTGNGLFDKVKLAKEESEQAQKEENAILGDYENKINQYIDGTRNENENNYSTEEVKIGTWINGKPLYRKVITGLKSPSQKDTWENVYTEPNAEMLIVEKIYMYFDDGRMAELNYYTGAGIFYTISGNAVLSYIYTSVPVYGNKDMLLIINYTKITDTTE